jgi:hypothetical protein
MNSSNDKSFISILHSTTILFKVDPIDLCTDLGVSIAEAAFLVFVISTATILLLLKHSGCVLDNKEPQASSLAVLLVTSEFDEDVI